MAKMIVARPTADVPSSVSPDGSRVTVGTLPAESKMAGAANESAPAEQRKPDVEGLAAGPKRGEKDEFLPAKYPLFNQDGTIRGYRTDR